jgi:hypothetical protein
MGAAATPMAAGSAPLYPRSRLRECARRSVTNYSEFILLLIEVSSSRDRSNSARTAQRPGLYFEFGLPYLANVSAEPRRASNDITERGNPAGRVSGPPGVGSSGMLAS